KKTGRPKLMSPEKLAEKLFLVFADKGYASTTITDLTQATGMKPASLYLAFGNKEGMYAAALAYYRKHWLAELSQCFQSQQLSFVERVHEFLLAAFTLFNSAGKPLGCIMTFSALAFHTEEEGLAAQLRDERQAFTRWLEKEAIEAQRMGELPGRMSPQAYACFILTMEKGLALNALERPKKEVIKEMIDAVVTTLFASTNQSQKDP
ncbi:TetR/AcrR family transcriptional regulator, partial [Escherichia coli]|nr:TetR/AcrR family transcriptional regulator [Escherichia coli]ELN9581877.1 TetR/AcrR family transcriptional regulator [Enterobacter roggenkampii]